MRWIAVIALLGGCRQILGFEGVVPTGDATVDPANDGALDGPVDAITLASCPVSYDLVSPAGGRYRLVTDTLDWIDAVVDCADDANTTVHTHLAVFTDDAERAAVHDLTNTTVWIGLTERVMVDDWKWVTLEPIAAYPPITTPPWANNEPDGGECGAIDETGAMEARMCDGMDDIKYLCECDVYADAPSQYKRASP